MTMKGIMEKGLIVFGTLLMLWFLISWADVLAHNEPGSTSQCHDWNAFQIMVNAL